tara:strand:+ start:184 stop:555 length:372 start_codon:yes stop_codon:yes gene_type:complete
MIKFKSLNQSKKFVEILKKKKLNTKYFVIYFMKNKNQLQSNISQHLNISFVMKKNVGNAVKRNKIKRKLKSTVQKILKEKQPIDLNYTYVIFGKNNVYNDNFRFVFEETCKTFRKIKQMSLTQ